MKFCIEKKQNQKMSFRIRIISSDMIVALHSGIKFSTKCKLKTTVTTQMKFNIESRCQ